MTDSIRAKGISHSVKYMHIHVIRLSRRGFAMIVQVDASAKSKRKGLQVVQFKIE